MEHMRRETILIIDDDAINRAILEQIFGSDYDVLQAENGKIGLEMILKNPQGLCAVLLDVVMPEMDGLEACNKIREFANVPISLLTAKTDDMDVLMGFENGADDYLTKPFNILELKARVRALLRRSGAQNGGNQEQNLLTVGNITLDLNGRNAFRSGTPVELTAKEFDVVEFLMRNPNRVYSREALLDTIWAYEYRSDIRTVDVHIRRLREKLEDNPAEPKHIMTKWGVGYYFRK